MRVWQDEVFLLGLTVGVLQGLALWCADRWPFLAAEKLQQENDNADPERVREVARMRAWDAYADRDPDSDWM